MSIKVMLVDDSTIVRALISRTLSHQQDIKVVATAGDGKEAIDTAKIHRPDVIVLDIEMPNMDGLTAMPYLLKQQPDVRIIVVSRLTQRNAKKSLEALEKGAADYVPKPNHESELNTFFDELVVKIKALGESVTVKKPVITNPAPYVSALQSQSTQSVTAAPPRAETYPSKKRIEAVAIASSTGGPQALLKIFSEFKGTAPRVPIFITQHMPPMFTACLADSISKVTGLVCKEGKQGDVAQAATIYIAPGGFHMLIKRDKGRATIHLTQDAPVNSCRPAADPMFASLSQLYGANLLCMVLTGMGRDGCDGAKTIAANGGTVIAQDAASCVVYGMPKAVAEAGFPIDILPLDIMANYMKRHIL